MIHCISRHQGKSYANSHILLYVDLKFGSQPIALGYEDTGRQPRISKHPFVLHKKDPENTWYFSSILAKTKQGHISLVEMQI